MRRPRSFIGPQGMGGMVSLWGASSLIKSVQRISVASVAVTITAVDVSRTILVWAGVNGTYTFGASGNECNKRVTLTNSTTVTPVASVTSGAVTATISVIELQPGVIKSVQYGAATITAPAQTGTAAITAVNIDKSIMLFLGTGEGPGSGAALAYNFANLTVNSAGDTITATQGAGASPGNSVTAFCMMELF